MYQHPPKPQPSGFYQQPTAQGPTISGYPPVPPPPPPPPKRSLWRRYREARKRTQWGIGCGSLLVLLALCSCVGIISPSALGFHDLGAPPMTSTHGGQPTVTQDATPHATSTSRATQAPTSLPTKALAPTSLPTHAPAPTQPPRPTPAPTQPPAHTGVNGNPWGYDFVQGNLIYNPPADFCTYFACIASFVEPDDPGDGYVVECADSSYSQSGGERGACSRHGGVMQPLYSH